MRSWAARYSYSSRLPSPLCQWFSDTGAARIRHVMWQQVQESSKQKNKQTNGSAQHAETFDQARVGQGFPCSFRRQNQARAQAPSAERKNVIPSTLSSVLSHSSLSKRRICYCSVSRTAPRFYGSSRKPSAPAKTMLRNSTWGILQLRPTTPRHDRSS